MGITYRKLSSKDLVDYREIRLESLKEYPDSFGASYEDQKIKKKLGFEEYIEQEHPDKFIVGAFDNTQLVGICGFFREDNAKRMNAGEIIQMYVKSKYQSNKVGYWLLQATLDEALRIKEIDNVELGVYASNQSANTLCEKAGFEEYGFKENQFNDRGTQLNRRLMVLSRDKHMTYR
ncbi:MAG: GNAT family N-acetyltransferase [Bacteroidetes bacterium]|nr:MAG: GNAT family N-acetyltransferase [Bacteroidota bacterium]